MYWEQNTGHHVPLRAERVFFGAALRATMMRRAIGSACASPMRVVGTTGMLRVSPRVFSPRLPVRYLSASQTIALVDKETLKTRLEHKATEPFLFVDVREPHELKHGAWAEAVNIPLGDINMAFGLRPGEFLRRYGVPKPNPDTEIFFVCRAGVRAMQAALNVSSLGWPRTVVYKGSFIDWFGRSY